MGSIAPSTAESTSRDLREINLAILPLLGLGLFAAVCLGVVEGTLSAVILWFVAALGAGALLGFIFGIPRALSVAPQADSVASASSANESNLTRWRANTNLEEIADWLTKIIVGLSLVHLDEIEKRLRAISEIAAASILKPEILASTQAISNAASPVASSVTSAATATATAAVASSAASDAASVASAALGCVGQCPHGKTAISIAMALIVGMVIVGFLLSYLYTRLFMPGALTRSEAEAAAFMATVRRAQDSAEQIPQQPVGSPVVASATDVVTARRVALAVPPDRPDLPLRALTNLAQEYDQLRIDMPEYSQARTRKMTNIVNRMKPLTLANRGSLDSLTTSPIAGERLAATVILLMNFDPRYIEWLADRFHQEAAFIGYQAASAFLSRIPVTDETERRRIFNAVDAAKSRMDPQRSERVRDDLIERILKDTRPS